MEHCKCVQSSKGTLRGRVLTRWSIPPWTAQFASGVHEMALQGNYQILYLTVFHPFVFSPHGRYISSRNEDGFLRIRDTRTDINKLVSNWKGHAPDAVWYVIFPKDGNGHDFEVLGCHFCWRPFSKLHGQYE
jgi:WD40 repeat protein